MALLHELFEASADRGPLTPAIDFDGERLTYAGLEERANRTARRLRGLGVRKEDRVAIMLPRGPALYEAMLAVLKAGGAYVPIDESTPAERARFIVEDSGAKVVVAPRERAREIAGAAAILDPSDEPAPTLSAGRLSPAETESAETDLCYVIYTSGTTGRPKGVLIEHRAAVALARAESKLYGVRADDRVCQLASPAFDASVEEIWAAFLHGAALVPAPEPVARAAAEFSGWAQARGVTMLSCVPTFLAMVEGTLPSVRLLILGGEAFPPALAARWLRPGLSVFNTYGPTEATVIATATLLSPGRDVTIGRPIEGCRVYLLGEDGALCDVDEDGEIAIAGTGVARGYLNRPDLQREKFVTRMIGGRGERLYRTGDLGRWNAEGELEFLGRVDGQVKVRGHRVELAEIEALLAQCDGVRAAAACVHEESQRIAAFVVPSPDGGPDRDFVRRLLSERLPSYMMPAFLDELEALPMTASGKIDRARLPLPRAPFVSLGRTIVAPRSEAERRVVSAFRVAAGRDEVSVGDDFFRDLDGHSLLAARTVSSLRGEPGFERLSIGDLYAHPTAESLARLGEKAAGSGKPDAGGGEFHHVSTAAYLACAAGQALGVLLVCAIYAWQWLGAYLAYGFLVVSEWPVRQAVIAAALTPLVTTPLVLALSIAFKWVLLGRVRPGRYPLWGWFYFRFWLARAVIRAAPVHFLDGTPLLNAYYRLMGARVGRDVFIGRHGCVTFDLLDVGDGTSIGLDTTFDGASVEGGMLRLAPVRIGRDCWVGNRCALGASSTLEDGAGLGDLSLLPDGGRVPRGELWKGSPAAAAGRLEAEKPRRCASAASTLAHAAGVLLLPLLPLAAFLPGLMAITHFGHVDEGFSFLIVSPLVAASFIVILCAELCAVKWALLGRLREGRYPLDGFFYWRKWFFDQLMTFSFEVTETLYETLYVAPWLRCLGARIGPRCEIEAIDLINPDLVEMDAECFVADLVLMGAPRVRSGWMTLGKTRLGSRVFVGNSAILPEGTTLRDNVLVGVLSLAPETRGAPAPEGTTWLGSPAISLPTRYRSARFSEEQTFRPPRRLVALRLYIELFRVILPSTFFVFLAANIINLIDILQDSMSVGRLLALLPLLYAAAGVLSIAITALIKWTLVGRFEPGEKPFWCGFVWRNDIVTGVYQNLCDLFFLGILRGTPFIAWALRALGMRVGRRCYIDSTWFTEFDLVELGDECALNENANLQTHLFEDRVIKMGTVRVGERCAVGAMSTALYDTRMEPGSSLGDLSLLMKGERLPAGTRWVGIPARGA